MKLWEKLFRRIVFKCFSDPETAHNAAMAGLKVIAASDALSSTLRRHFFITDPALAQTIAGIRFPNPVGLAAGFDKNAKAARGLEALGFGFLELGTVTRHAQPGNSRPRIFRLEKDRALINRLGFNNEGADAIAERLASLGKLSIPVGISIGKSKITPLEDAAEDHLYSFEKLYPYADYFAVNVSSPNTPGLRSLQDKESLDKILSALQEKNRTRADKKALKPIFVKIAPDLSYEVIEEVLGVCFKNKIDGIIAVNTTISREGLMTRTSESGGLSGKPLAEKARNIVSYIRSRAPKLPIIGVGGIFDGNGAYEMLNAGANLVQIYTGFVYGGPATAGNINRRLLMRIKEVQRLH